jgi:hypothetical protein
LIILIILGDTQKVKVLVIANSQVFTLNKWPRIGHL